MKFAVTLLVALFVGTLAAAEGALIDPALKSFAGTTGTNSVQRVLILTKAVAPSTTARPNRYDRAGVVNYFQEASRQSVTPLLTAIQNKQVPGVRVLQAYWINGSILADVTRDGLQNLAHQPSVTKIYANRRTYLDPALALKPARPHRAEDVQQEYHFPAIGLDKLMKEAPQVTGQNAVVGIVDTGVDGTHPALNGKVALFFNGQTRTTTPPKDFDEHGTHVSGTIAGGDRQNNLIGVAPGAKIIMAGVVNQGFDAMLSGMQFFLDKAKNPAVGAVKAIGCSWNTQGAPDQEVFYRAIAAWEAAGILPVFSAGNSGRSGGITHPHEYPGTFAVAAFGADGKIADFSSWGPGHYKGQDTQKPDIAAPGVDITSSLPGGQYGQMSGTSMAQPHVTGTVALMLQVKPDLNPAQIRQLLMRGAEQVQGRQPGQWSPDFGFGRLNAYNAVKLTSQFQGVVRNMFLNSLSSMIMTPEMLDAQSILNATMGEVGGEVDQWTDTDTSGWITAAQAFGG